MNIDELFSKMDDDVIQKLYTAIEIGKWENNEPLTKQQKEEVMQLIILHQNRENTEKQHLSVDKEGNLIHLSKDELIAQFDDSKNQRIL